MKDDDTTFVVGLYIAFFTLSVMVTGLAAFEAGGASLFLERLPWIVGFSLFLALTGALPVGLFYAKVK